MGQRILRREDDRFLRGEGLYVENLELPDALHATFVRSPYAHARIGEIDASAVSACRARRSSRPPTSTSARSSRRRSRASTSGWCGRSSQRRRPLRRRHRRRRRHRDAERRRRRRRARAVDYDPLPVVVDPESGARGRRAALSRGGTNVCTSHPVERDEALFDGCDVVVSGGLVSQRLAAARSSRGCASPSLGDDGRMTLWLSTQTPHQDRQVLGRSSGSSRRGARRRARRRWGVRREGSGCRGDPRLLARPQDRTSGPLDRDAGART